MPRCSLIIGIISHVLCAVLFLSFSVPAHAALIATQSATITATVPEQSFNPPTLISPYNNSTTNQANITFSWKRPSPLPSTPLNHYNLYIDNVLFAENLPDGLTSLDYYFYTVHRISNTFFLELKNGISEGYHHWYVVAYNNSGLSSTSDTWTFYVDTIAPHIKLTSADNNILNWNSADLSTIPSVDQRYLYVTQNPLLTGEVEPYANLQFTLLCPYGVPNCTSLTQTYSYPNGHWTHRYYNLIPNKTYTVILSSTDAGSNSVTFPVFYLIYLSGPQGGTITPTITPPIIQSPTPEAFPSPASPSASVTPTIELIPPTEIFIPAGFLPVPPVAPSPPPEIITPPVIKKPFNYSLLFLILFIFGLPLHLAMTQFGKGVEFKYTLIFLLTLIFPFFYKKNNQTYPFSTILIYDPNKLDTTWQTIISDINGKYFLKENPPEKLFVKVFSFNRIFNPNIINTIIFTTSCLFPVPKDRENKLERLQHRSYDMRPIPLAVAILTSSISLFVSPSYFAVIYLYLSLQCLFSEYFYPKYSK